MLQQILSEIESAQGTINLAELARKLAVQPSALEGMIDFWVKKGKIKRENDQDAALDRCNAGTCSGGCPGPNGCPFIMTMPTTYSLTTPDTSE